MEALRIPLFQLQTVLFPGGQLDLRIFEIRYVDMVRRCLRNSTDFGVVAIKSGREVGFAEPFTVGTTARIDDWSSEQGGLLGLSVVGVDRFRIESYERADDGLYEGTVVPMPVHTRAELRAAHRWARLLLMKILADELRAHPELAPRLDDADWVCWNLADRLPLALPERQALLEADDLNARFAQLEAKAAGIVEVL